MSARRARTTMMIHTTVMSAFLSESETRFSLPKAIPPLPGRGIPAPSKDESGLGARIESAPELFER